VRKVGGKKRKEKKQKGHKAEYEMGE